MQVSSGPLFPDHCVEGRNTCSFLERNTTIVLALSRALAFERINYTVGHSGSSFIRISSGIDWVV